MADLIQTVSLANTFGEWVRTTNDTVSAINTLYYNDFIKPAGTLYLYNPGIGIYVQNTAVFTGLLEVTGTQGSFLARHNAEIQNQLFLTNKDGGNQSTVVLSANGVANLNFVNIVGSGLAANVSNNMSIGGTLTITGNTSTSANLVVSKDITGNNQTISYDLNVGEDVTVGRYLTVTNTAILNGHLFATQSVAVTSNTYTGNLVSNSNIQTVTFNSSGKTFAANLISNTAVITPSLYVSVNANVNYLSSNTNVVVSGTTFTDFLQANTAANTRTLSVTGTTSTDFLQANTAANTRTLSVTGTTFTDFLQANTAANTRTLSVTGTTFTDFLQANTAANTRTLSVTGTASVDTLQANTLVNTPTVNTNIVVSNSVQANAVVNTAYVNTVSISVSTTTSTDFLQANTAANTRTLSVTGTTFTNFLQANTAANTRTLSVTGTSFTDYLQANTAANTRTLSVTGTASVNVLQANASVNTAYLSSTGTLSVSGVANVNQLTSNTNIVANSGTVYASVVSAPTINFTNIIGGSGSQILATTGTFEGNLTANGNFIINGATVYTTNIFTLRDGTPLLPGVAGYAAYTINRGEGTNAANANASLRWDNTNKYWAVRDVDTPANYYRIANTVDIAGINTTISINAVSANAVITTANTNMKNYVDVANTNLKSYVDAANTNMKNYVDTANTFNRVYTNSQITANGISVNAVIIQANTAMKNYVDGNFLKVASGGSTQTIGSDVTVTGNLIVNGTTTTVNTNIVQITDSLIKLAQNQVTTDSVDIGFYGPYYTGGAIRYTGLFRKAAGNYYLASGITTDPTANNITQYGLNYRGTLDANFTGGTVSGLASPISAADGGTGVTSSTGSGSVVLNNSPSLVGMPITPTAPAGNNSTMIATTAFVQTANTNMKTYVESVDNSLRSDVSIEIDILQTQITSNVQNLQTQITSNVEILQTQITSNVVSLQSQITANSISANAVITTANTNLKSYVDANKVASVSSDSNRIVITGTSTAPVLNLATTSVNAGTYGGINYIPSFIVDSHGRLTFSGNNVISATSLNGQVPIASGGTGASSSGQAITNLLPVASSGDSGKVLTTGGPGTFYWATAAGGGASAQGTAISSTRVTYSATAGQTLFTGVGSYTAGTNQLRVYINGVRQFTSDYAETSSTSFTLTSGATLGDAVVAEVDGYYTYTQLASQTSYTASGALTATTVQQGIDQLETNKMPKSGGTFTGQVVLPAGTTSVAPLRLTSGTNLTTPIAGALEFNGSNLFITNSGSLRKTLAYVDDVHYIGTTSIALNRPSAGQTLTGVSIDGGASTFSSTSQNSQFNSIGIGTAASTTAGEIRATNNITAYYSDERLKENITPIPNALGKVMAISGVTFNANDTASKYGYTNKSEQVGVIAQEIEKVLPQIVVPAPFDISKKDDGSEYSTSGNNYKTVQYEKLVPLLIEAIKELNNKVSELQNQIDNA